MDPANLERVLFEFLGDSRQAVVLEDGAELFDFRTAKYSISGGHDKCVLHMWSAERNTVRRVLDVHIKGEVLNVIVQRFGQSKPGKLEICRGRDARTTTARKSARAAHQAMLRKILEREYPGCTVERLTTNMDLERSFGPVYTRGLIRQGKTGFAVFGVNAQESQGTIDDSLTFAILWFDLCRERALRCYVEGLKLFVPAGSSAVVRERIAHLDHSAAKWQLYELNEVDRTIRNIDCADRGNIETRLVHAPSIERAHERFAEAIARVRSLAPVADIEVVSTTEISFRIHGLEVARAEMISGASFRSEARIVFGAGANETELTESSAEQFATLAERVCELRRPNRPLDNAVIRMCPERWLESIIAKNVAALDDRLGTAPVYEQVPAFSSADRGVIDLLAINRDGRLVVIELKANEDIHLPLQGLDYWTRVVWHQARGEFTRNGYFAGRELSPQPPLLYLVAPALHVHPATDTIFRYLSPEIDCTLIGIDERWREGVRVVFRKHNERSAHAHA